MLMHLSLSSFLEERLKTLNCKYDETKAYVISILSDPYVNKLNKLNVNESIVLLASKAISFQDHQILADSVLWSLIIVPEFHEINRDLVCNIAAVSYMKCGNLLRGSWPLYYELADNMNVITQQAHMMLSV